MNHSRTSKVFPGWLAATVLVFAWTDAPLAKDAGTVVSLRGGALERQESGEWKNLVAGEKVIAGERLRTGKDAVAVIEFPGVGRFVMGPASEIEMGREPKDFTTKMNRGALWLQSSLPPGSRAAISTPIAIAGIRGTAFSMVFGATGESVCACTCTGTIEVITPDGGKLAVPKGQYVAIDAGKSMPAGAQSSVPVLAQSGTVFDFCLECHIVGGKGELKPKWR